MKAVLRHTLQSFFMITLQNWLTLIGVALVAVGMALRTQLAGIGLGVGIAFIVLVPLMLGGVSMRATSTRNLLYLRPGGRWKMIAAALLTVLVTTLLCAGGFWAMTGLVLAPESRGAGDAVPNPFDFAMAAFGVCSLAWMATFFASASRLVAMTAFIAFLTLSVQKWEPLRAFGPVHVTLALIGAVSWILFSIWYLRTPQVRPLGWTIGNNDWGSNNWLGTNSKSADNSVAAATRAYLLGSPSLLSHLLSGAITLLLVVGFTVFMPKFSGNPLPLVVVSLCFYSVIGAGVSSVATQRARMLWLRAGLDRAGMFALCERTAMQAVSLMLLSGALVLTVACIAIRPDITGRILLFVATQVAWVICLFYFGLSVTRHWTAGTIVWTFLFGIGTIAQLVLLLVQVDAARPMAAPIVIGVSLLLAAWFRFRARRNWLSIDWHVLRPPVRPYRLA